MPKRLTRTPDRSEITNDTPLRLAVAAALAYPDGSMTASGLRRERDAGRLVVELTAGKEFTTLADIARMRELCRRKVKPQQPLQARRTPVDDHSEGASAAASARLALDRLRAIGDAKLKAEREARQKEQQAASAAYHARTGKPVSKKRPPTSKI